ncbi:MAG: hypothetical protein QXF10_05410 [Ignisphaera sp.]
MHHRIMLMGVKYSYICNGFKYLLLYSFTLAFYLLFYSDVISRTVSIALSSLAILATLLSDKGNIAQLITAFRIVGLRKSGIAFTIWVFIALRTSILMIVYGILARDAIALTILFITSVIITIFILFSIY